jgi:pimeloyl-ACP methyl ester carboxylesterase
MPWIEFMEQIFGPENYFVHFNRQPGVADAVLDENTEAFLRNLFRKDLPATPPAPGMMMNLATAPAPLGQPVMSEADLAVLANAFRQTGFTSSINWYRNLDRNWHLLADVDPVIHQPALMIYGMQDMIPPADNLQELVPNVTEVSLNCGHWIQQELPAETTTAMLDWLG